MIYPHLCNSYLLTDREPENSLIFLSVQIFTVPSICSILVSPPYDFLSTLLDILYAFFTEQTDPPRPPPLDNSNEEEETSRLSSLASGTLKPRRLILPPNRTVRWIDPESGPAFKQKRYFQLFSDLNHLITSPQVQKFIVSSTSLLEQLSRFLSLFEGMNPVVRAVGSHVEYESDSWVSAFNVTIQLSKLCRTFGQSFNNEACTSLELVKSLSSLIKVMSNHRSDSSYHRIELGGQSYSSIEFNVAKGKNSFHHPLTWLWAEIAKNVKLLDQQILKDELGLQGGLSELIKSTAADEDGESRFLSIMEQPLRGKFLPNRNILFH
jgi:E3 ubiquitin-protein ligase UBR1